MSRQVDTIDESSSLLEASFFMEQISHTGLPVVSGDHRLTGFITLRDIMKGRKARQMSSPVKAYMSRQLITASPSATIREIEELLFGNNIGHLPILEGDRIIGIVTRTDYMNYKRSLSTSRKEVLEEMGLELKEPVSSY
jgi:tRNA nucleotidyltransferase (CCA-adding enzyme)